MPGKQLLTVMDTRTSNRLCKACKIRKDLSSSLSCKLQRGQSELLPGKFESVEQVKEYEQQWHTLYEDTTSGLGEEVQYARAYSRCMCA